MSIWDVAAIYTPLILSVVRFKAVVLDPQGTLASNLAVTIVVTITPSLLTSTTGHIIQSVLSLLAIVLPAVYITVILMGAPFTTHIPETMLLSLHLAVMAFFKPLTELGLVRKNWLPFLPAVTGEDSDPTAGRTQKSQPKEGLLGLVWGTLIGAYLGAVPIPLDWDRDWQRWPVTVYIGACIGLALGGTLQLVYDRITSQGTISKGHKSVKNGK